ncbi:hypothetical protein K488DRAFT_47527 [Vararia minispora EC-137]|uniref:Uncharacterized protein n=1 Tax=Vararia minispora EC-137 TaxID=1314806 RepID=A0ACB8QPF2_9AGAM|nr:hypothetical protein K488DRAFT_47527 [Vararia minispora EC-137]
MDYAHFVRQLRFVVPGGLATYWIGTTEKIAEVWEHESGLARPLFLTSAGAGILTVTLFLYVLLFPVIKGVPPNYRSWRKSGELSSVIPILTASIIIGWTFLAYTLGRYTTLGYVKGTMGSLGLYALAFGIMGLLPAPRIRRP